MELRGGGASQDYMYWTSYSSTLTTIVLIAICCSEVHFGLWCFPLLLRYLGPQPSVFVVFPMIAGGSGRRCCCLSQSCKKRGLMANLSQNESFSLCRGYFHNFCPPNNFLLFVSEFRIQRGWKSQSSTQGTHHTSHHDRSFTFPTSQYHRITSSSRSGHLASSQHTFPNLVSHPVSVGAKRAG